MLRTKFCINVYSYINSWIDFCIVLEREADLTKAEEVVREADDDWWEYKDAECEVAADWISRCLTKNDIEHEIYYKNEVED